ncbi:MAG TPA: hypothetical protein VFM78_04025 [Marinobacter sp.]|nr:hypothetical protein [Marinobacter sp.]
MSLISKPFDDSGIDFVDDVARYGLAIYAAVDGRRRSFTSASALPKAEGKAIALAICRVIDNMINKEANGVYRAECVRSANALYIEVTGIQPPALPSGTPHDAEELSREVSGIVTGTSVVPDDQTVTTHTMLLALVWAALMFCTENTPLPEARAVIKAAIASGGHSVH